MKFKWKPINDVVEKLEVNGIEIARIQVSPWEKKGSNHYFSVFINIPPEGKTIFNKKLLKLKILTEKDVIKFINKIGK